MDKCDDCVFYRNNRESDPDRVAKEEEHILFASQQRHRYQDDATANWSADHSIYAEH